MELLSEVIRFEELLRCFCILNEADSVGGKLIFIFITKSRQAPILNLRGKASMSAKGAKIVTTH